MTFITYCYINIINDNLFYGNRRCLLEISKHWETIRTVFEEGFKSCSHFAVATVNEDGSPHVTPIGALILLEDKTGFYFERKSGKDTAQSETKPQGLHSGCERRQGFLAEFAGSRKILDTSWCKADGDGGRIAEGNPR